jgi:hypothetical protein
MKCVPELFLGFTKISLCSAAICFRNVSEMSTDVNTVLAGITGTCSHNYVDANIFICCVSCSCFLVPSSHRHFWRTKIEVQEIMRKYII